MKGDDATFELHLTPTGWVRDKPRPADAVETWHERHLQSTMFAPTYVTTRMVWADDSIPEPQRTALREQFPEPFAKPYAGSTGEQP